MTDSLVTARPEFVSPVELEAAVKAFITAIGWGNAEYLRANLRLTVERSDALRALNSALIEDFNAVRQEQIRAEQERKPCCARCERELRGYRGPLCRYCDGTAE